VPGASAELLCDAFEAHAADAAPKAKALVAVLAQEAGPCARSTRGRCACGERACGERACDAGVTARAYNIDASDFRTRATSRYEYT
jgi:hypothetical protein